MILKKGPFRNPPAFLPRPLLRAGKQPRRGESIPPDKLFRPASSALVFLIIWILLEIVSNFVQKTPHWEYGRISAIMGPTKKLSLVVAVLIVSLFVFTAGAVFAQNRPVALPSAGLTPESPLYFLDRFGEGVRQLFAFSPGDRARLQITFAAERIAEIRVILETRGVEAKGLAVAQSRLHAHLARTAAIVVDLKSKGEDVDALASALNDAIETPKFILAQTFKEQKQLLAVKGEALEVQIQAVQRAGDTERERVLTAELAKIRAQGKLLGSKEADISDDITAEEVRIEKQNGPGGTPEPEPPPVPGSRVCTADVKQCPDGSYVPRGGPNCTFVACPAPLPRPGETQVSLRAGEQESSFLLEKVFPDHVTGLNFAEYPIPTGTGYPVTLYIEEVVSNGCTIRLTLTRIEGNIAVFSKKTNLDAPCPICLAKGAMIDTSLGLVAVEHLAVGMPVWTMGKNGQRVSGVVTKTSKVPVPPTHQMVHLVLSDNRELFVSPGHPMMDGRTVGELAVGDLYDGVTVMSTERVPYGEDATYDLLPSGGTGSYWANGILIGSTLKQ